MLTSSLCDVSNWGSALAHKGEKEKMMTYDDNGYQNCSPDYPREGNKLKSISFGFSSESRKVITKFMKARETLGVGDWDKASLILKSNY